VEYENRTRTFITASNFFITVFQDIEHRTTATHDIFRDTISVCNKGRTRYIMPPLYPNLHDITDEFASAVCHLPVDYDKDAYRQFLDTWGTVCIIKDYYVAIGYVTSNIIGQLYLQVRVNFTFSHF
jgi:hypothetical protein